MVEGHPLVGAGIAGEHLGTGAVCSATKLCRVGLSVAGTERATMRLVARFLTPATAVLPTAPRPLSVLAFASGGCGLMTLLITLVSRRQRVKGQSFTLPRATAISRDRPNRRRTTQSRENPARLLLSVRSACPIGFRPVFGQATRECAQHAPIGFESHELEPLEATLLQTRTVVPDCPLLCGIGHGPACNSWPGMYTKSVFPASEGPATRRSSCPLPPFTGRSSLRTRIGSVRRLVHNEFSRRVRGPKMEVRCLAPPRAPPGFENPHSS